MKLEETYDVIIVGGGHAGCEAAHAAATLGSKVLLVTQNLEEQICGKENTKNGLLTVYEADMKKFGQTIAEKKRKFSEFLSHENRRERKFMKTHEKNRAQKQQKLMAHVMTMVNEAFQ